MSMTAEVRHDQFVAQRDTRREELQAEKYASDIVQKLNHIEYSSLTRAAGPARKDQVSFSVPGAVFNGREHKYLTVTFDLGLRGTEPKIYEGRHPGTKDVELDIATPKKLTAIEHLLREENALGAQLLRSLKDSIASGSDLEQFAPPSNQFSPSFKGDRVQIFRLHNQVQTIRADGSEFDIDVHCDIQTDNRGNPIRFSMLAVKDGSSLQRRPLAGQLMVNSIFRGIDFEAGARNQVKELLQSKFPGRRK